MQPMEERTTAEVIETLGNDVDRCHGLLIEAFDQGVADDKGCLDADYEFAARQLVRAIFAYIEAVTFSVKVKAAGWCLENEIDLSDGERFLSVDVEHVLNNKGEVVERQARLSLAENIRFALSLLEKSMGQSNGFDASVEWWACLKASIRVRDRLTHPRMPEDIDISGDEIVTALKAYSGFSKHLASQPADS